MHLEVVKLRAFIAALADALAEHSIIRMTMNDGISLFLQSHRVANPLGTVQDVLQGKNSFHSIFVTNVASFPHSTLTEKTLETSIVSLQHRAYLPIHVSPLMELMWPIELVKSTLEKKGSVTFYPAGSYALVHGYNDTPRPFVDVFVQKMKSQRFRSICASANVQPLQTRRLPDGVFVTRIPLEEHCAFRIALSMRNVNFSDFMRGQSLSVGQYTQYVLQKEDEAYILWKQNVTVQRLPLSDAIPHLIWGLPRTQHITAL